MGGQTDYLPVVSLVFALLVVFIGAIVQLWIAKRQMHNTLAVAHQQMRNSLAVTRRQIVGPIRQKWIDKLRSQIAELLATSQAHWIYGTPTDSQAVHRQLLLIEKKIELMLNPDEPDHQALLKELEKLIQVVLRRQLDTPMMNFIGPLTNATSLAQSVLKREWEAVKKNK